MTTAPMKRSFRVTEGYSVLFKKTLLFLMSNYVREGGCEVTPPKEKDLGYQFDGFVEGEVRELERPDEGSGSVEPLDKEDKPGFLGHLCVLCVG